MDDAVEAVLVVCIHGLTSTCKTVLLGVLDLGLLCRNDCLGPRFQRPLFGQQLVLCWKILVFVCPPCLPASVKVGYAVRHCLVELHLETLLLLEIHLLVFRRQFIFYQY